MDYYISWAFTFEILTAKCKTINVKFKKDDTADVAYYHCADTMNIELMDYYIY
jgi:hypothetical protein